MDEDKSLMKVINFKNDVEQSKDLTTKQKLMLVALSATDGIVSRAAVMAGISTNVHYDGMMNNPTYKQFHSQINENLLDWYEEMMIECAKEKNFNAIKFFLQSKGKHRGYQQDNVNNNTININPVQFVFSPMVPEQMVPEIKETPIISIEESKEDGNDN